MLIKREGIPNYFGVPSSTISIELIRLMIITII